MLEHRVNERKVLIARMKKRSWSHDSDDAGCAPKKAREEEEDGGLSHNNDVDENNNRLHSNMATPNRVARIRLHAKKKGLGTPSPGRANAAITMMQLTRRVELGPTDLGQMLREMMETYGTKVMSLEVNSLARKYRTEPERVIELAQVLKVFGIARYDVQENSVLWIGCDSLVGALDDVVRLASLGSSPTITHFTRQMVALLIKHCEEAWSLSRIGAALELTSSQMQRDIISVLVELKLVKPMQEDRYAWCGPVPMSSTARMARHLCNSMPPPPKTTPADLIKKPTVTATPQSVSERRSSRAAVRKAVHSAIDNNFKYVKISLNEEDLSSENKNPNVISNSNNTPCSTKSVSSLTSRESASKVRNKETFRFSRVGLQPVSSSSNNSKFRSAVLLSTPELSHAKTRTAVHEHLQNTYFKQHHEFHLDDPTTIKPVLTPAEMLRYQKARLKTYMTQYVQHYHAHLIQQSFDSTISL